MFTKSMLQNQFFLVIDTTLASDDVLRFRKNLSERTEK